MNKLSTTILLSVAAAVASASPLSLGIDQADTGHWTLNGNTEYSWIGRLTLGFESNNYLGFCSDATTTYVGGGNDFILTDTSALSTANRGRIAYLVNHYTNTATDASTGAALQLAIWDELYDSSPGSVLTGNFVVNSFDHVNFAAVTSLADSYLADADLHAEVAYYFKPTGTNQSFVAPNPNFHATPEPASMAAIGLGLLTVVRRRRKA